MRTIVKTELLKLKRYHIIWAGIALMLLSVLLTLFTSMANNGSVWDFRYLIEQVIKNNMSMIFPMCIALIAGYIISREEKDDVLKNIITIPISFKKLLVGKLIVCAMLSILLCRCCIAIGASAFTPAQWRAALRRCCTLRSARAPAARGSDPCAASG